MKKIAFHDDRLHLHISSGLDAGPGRNFARLAQWLAQLRVEALAEGISPATFDRALAGIEEPEPEVIASDRNQPGIKTEPGELSGKAGFEESGGGRVCCSAISTAGYWEKISARYHVQPRFLLGSLGDRERLRPGPGQPADHPGLGDPRLWPASCQSTPGANCCKVCIFSKKGWHPWSRSGAPRAGALGGLQFMPSVYRRYAVDYNGDGRVNIFGKIRAISWPPGRPIWPLQAGTTTGPGAARSSLTGKMDPKLLGHDRRHLPLSRWQELGVGADGSARVGDEASLLCPDPEAGRYFLVYDNFRVILKWNRSDLFALAVGTLSGPGWREAVNGQNIQISPHLTLASVWFCWCWWPVNLADASSGTPPGKSPWPR